MRFNEGRCIVEEPNWLGIFVAAVSAFVLGGLWYSPLMFGKKWAGLVGLSPEDQAKANPGLVYGLGFALTLAAAFVFAMFLGADPALGFAVGAGLSAGLVWVAGSFGVNYLFEQKPFALFAINGAYHTLQFTLYGFVLGIM